MNTIEAYPHCEEVLPYFQNILSNKIKIVNADSPFSALPKQSLGLCEYKSIEQGTYGRYLSVVRDELLPFIDYNQTGISELEMIASTQVGSFEVCLFTLPSDATNLGRIDLSEFTGDRQAQFAIEAKNRVDGFVKNGYISSEEIVKRFGTVYSGFVISANQNKILSLLQCQLILINQ